MLKFKNGTTNLAVYALTALALVGCGKEEFQKQQVTASAAAVGFREIPAKVDIVMVSDNSASLSVAMNTVQGQLSGFTSKLRNQYWDYHVAKSPIVAPSPIREVLVNPDFNTRYLKDGTDIGTSHMVVSPYARTDASTFSLTAAINNTNGSDDRTYANTYNNLVEVTTSGAAVNFLRPDAMLAVIVVTNGAEGSVDYDHNGVIDSQAAWTVLQQHANNLLSLKNNDQRLVRFYPVAAYGYKPAGSNTNYCLTPGSPAQHGGSYFAMNNFIQGLPQYNSSAQELLNFCNPVSLTNVLSDIAANLEITKQAYVYSNIVLDEEPVDSTLVVSKNGTPLARSATNGFEYKGFGSAYTITHILDQNGQKNPIYCPGSTTEICGLNKRTGYVIQLNGDARLVGSDVPGVSYEAQ